MRKVMFALAVVAGAFLVAQPANAQCTYRMNDVGRPHGYLSGPCNGGALGYAGAYPARSNSAAPAPATSQVNGQGCVGRCPEKCQASWQRLGFRSVEACYVKWGKLNRLGIARQCEAANRARLPGQPKLPGC